MLNAISIFIFAIGSIVGIIGLLLPNRRLHVINRWLLKLIRFPIGKRPERFYASTIKVSISLFSLIASNSKFTLLKRLTIFTSLSIISYIIITSWTQGNVWGFEKDPYQFQAESLLDLKKVFLENNTSLEEYHNLLDKIDVPVINIAHYFDVLISKANNGFLFDISALVLVIAFTIIGSRLSWGMCINSLNSFKNRRYTDGAIINTIKSVFLEIPIALSMLFPVVFFLSPPARIFIILGLLFVLSFNIYIAILGAICIAAAFVFTLLITGKVFFFSILCILFPYFLIMMIYGFIISSSFLDPKAKWICGFVNNFVKKRDGDVLRVIGGITAVFGVILFLISLRYS